MSVASRAEQEEFCGCGRGNSVSFQRDFVGQFQGSDARFLLNQGVSDFALRDFPITFHDKFFCNKRKKFHDPCIRPIVTLRLRIHLV